MVGVWIAALWMEGNSYKLGVPLLNFTNYGAVLLLFAFPFSLLIGAGAELLANRLAFLQKERVQQVALGALLLAGFVFGFERAGGVEGYRYFVSQADAEAMGWISAKIPADAVFAINTDFWMPNAPHGMDAGYWIPYFTGRQTTSSTMLQAQEPRAFSEKVTVRSRAALELARNPGPGAVNGLCELGVRYAYVGALKSYGSPAFNAEAIGAIPSVQQVYARRGVSIFKLCPK
jgi:hypothetical protein